MVKGSQKQLTNLGNDLSGTGDNASVISLSGSGGSVEMHNTRLANTTGFVMTTQASVPGGNPAAGHSTLWVKSSDGYAYLTDPSGTSRLFAGPQGPQGPQGPGGGGGASGTLAQVLNNGNTTDGYNIVIVQNDMISSYMGADITVRTSNSGGSGDLYLQTSTSSQASGNIYLQAGNAGTIYNAGGINLTAGTATGSGIGGNATLYAGSSTSGSGGYTSIGAGQSGSGDGGFVSVLGGASLSSGYGGDVRIRPGAGPAAIYGGNTIFYKPNTDEAFTINYLGYITTTTVGQEITLRPSGDLYLQTTLTTGGATGNIYAQVGATSGANNAGYISITGGAANGTGSAGNVYLSGGASTSGSGGSAFVSGGSSGSGLGGQVSLRAGLGPTHTYDGYIVFYVPTGDEAFKVDRFGSIMTSPTLDLTIRPAHNLYLQNSESNGTIYVQSQSTLYLQAQNGGNNYVYAGNNSGIGGRLYLYGGDSSASNGGQVYLVGGDGYLDGGAIELRGGVATNGEGGCASLIAADGFSGGNTFIYAGNATAASSWSGNITIRAGASSYAGTTTGSVTMSGGAGDLTGPTAMNGGNASVVSGQGAVGGIALLAGGLGGTVGGMARVRSGYGNGCPGGDVEIMASGDIADIYKPGSIKLISNITDSIVINQDGYITSQAGEFKTVITPDYARGYNYNDNIEKDIIPILKAEPRDTKIYFYEQVYMFEKSDVSNYYVDFDITGLGDGYSSMFIEYDVLATPIGSSGAIYKKFIAGWVRTNNTLSSYGTAATIATINSASDHWTIAQPAVPNNNTLRITIGLDGGNYRFMVRAKLSLQHSFGN